MVDSRKKITQFEDLRVWQDAIDFAVLLYGVTRSFPKDEQYGLVSQIRRAATSISANIAEGFGRRSLKDKSHFYTIAYGSILEVKNFVYLSVRLEYLDTDCSETIVNSGISLQKQLNSLLRTVNA